MPHPRIGDRPQITHQVEIGCGGGDFKHKEEAIPPTSTHADSLGKDAVTDFESSLGMAMKQGTIIDATLIAAPSTTKNKKGERYPEMYQTKKGNQCY